MITDQELVSLLRQKNEEAFRQLFLDYKDLIYNTALNLVQNDHEASDILQDVFVEVFQSISTFKEKSALSTWIYRICVNKSLMVLRKRRRFSRFSFFDSPSKGTNYNEPVNWVHPGVIAENKENARLLYQAIAKLPDKYRVSFTLFHIEELSQIQIAEITKQSVSAVETQIFRAKKRLAEILGSLAI
jgi:RNA polymerase sigma-70 factor (ECF subfamily)